MTTAADEAPSLPPLPAERDWPRPWMGPFLRSLSVMPDVTSACRIARVGRRTVYDARDGVPARGEREARAPVPGFAEAWEEALALCRDFIENQVHRWITTGVPVRSVRRVTKTKKGADGKTIESTVEEFTTEGAERSATLMIFWLKAHYPERYRWAERVETTGADGGPVRISAVDDLDRQIAELSAELAARGADEPVPDEPAIPAE